jgi:CRP-like cAMP-binding protein
VPATAPNNRLIASLARREREALLDQSQTVALPFGDTLCRAGETYRHVHFPLTGYVSLVVGVDGHPPLELGMIGNEGMLGATLALGVDEAPMRAQVQGAGSALRIGIRPFQRQLRDSSGLQVMLRRYHYLTTRQLALSSACSRFHGVEQRLSRWLLMSDDRAQGDPIHLTHQFLADMLGVRRSAVTIAAGALQGRGLIHYRRGEIRILERTTLEATSCGCYADSAGG